MAGPWEKFQTKPTPTEGPWNKFKTEVPVKENRPSVAMAIPGIAEGVAESLNPLTIPRSLEVLARAPFQKVEQAPATFAGMLQTAGQKLGAAEKKAVLPSGDVGQIAAVLRTAGRLPANLDRPIKDVFKEESAAQKEYEKSIPSWAKPVGGFIGSAASILSAMAPLSKAAGLGPAAEKMASKAAVQSLKPSGKAGKQLLSNERRVAQLGKTLRDEKIVTAGASYKDIMKRVADRLDKYGEEIGHFSKVADDAVARDSSIRGVVVDDIMDRVNKSMIPQLVQEGRADVAKQVSDWVNGNLRGAAGEAKEIGFKQMQAIKTTLAKTKSKFNAVNDTNSSEAFQDLWNILNEAHESGIDDALKKAGSTDDIKQFLKAKETYRDLKDAEKYIGDTVGRISTNRFISPTDYIAGSTGAIGGAAAAGVPGAIAALPLAVGNRVLRTRGNQLAAGFFGSIADQANRAIRPIPAAAAAIGSSKVFLPEDRSGQ